MGLLDRLFGENRKEELKENPIPVGKKSKKESFVNEMKGYKKTPEQLKEEAKDRQFLIAWDALQVMKKGVWKNMPEITTTKGVENLLKRYGYEEEIAFNDNEKAILDKMGMDVRNDNIPKETLEYFKREDMARLVGKIEDMSIEEAAKFQYTEKAANRFIPHIPDAMKNIMDNEIAEKEAELEENQK